MTALGIPPGPTHSGRLPLLLGTCTTSESLLLVGVNYCTILLEKNFSSYVISLGVIAPALHEV